MPPRIRLSDTEYSIIKRRRSGAAVGIIGDTHFPYEHPRYLDFCATTFEEYGCKEIYHIGDVIDSFSISRHTKVLDVSGIRDEWEAARASAQAWKKVFPKVKVCVGNHDQRPIKQAKAAGIPEWMLKGLGEILDLDWRVDFRWIVQTAKGPVGLLHGTGHGAKNAHLNLAIANGISTVIGHQHRNAGVAHSSPKFGGTPLWGMQVGCGVDEHSIAMAYARDYKDGICLGCGVITAAGDPVYVPMPV